MAQREDPSAVYNSLAIVWAALAMSVVLYFVITKAVLQPPPEQNESLAWIFAVMGIAALAASFVLKSLFLARAAAQRSAALLRTAFLLAFALAEVPALMGMAAYLVTGWEYSWVMFVIAALGFGLHFPRRNTVDDILGGGGVSRG